MKVCDSCASDPTFSFLKKISDFDSFFLIESPSTDIDFYETEFDGVICNKCEHGLIGVY